VELAQDRQTRFGRRGSKSIIWTVAVLLLAAAGAYYFLRRPLLAALATGPEYYSSFATVGGLRPGDEVRYGGIPVGRVRSVHIDPANPSKIRATYRVDETTPMRVDTRASVVDVTGAVTRFISLRAGSPRSVILPEGKEVVSETGATPQETLANLTVLLARADTLFEAAAPLLHGDFFARLDRTSKSLDRMATAVVRSSEKWGPGVERAIGRLDTVVVHTNRLLAAVDSATPELRASLTEALAMLQDTRTLVADLRAGAAQGGGLAELMQNLTATSNDLSRVVARLDRSPASLLRGQRPIAKTAGPSLHD
jgi:phospholipid/cholesterol/gamma-HCH transport system substrate-binding protein